MMNRVTHLIVVALMLSVCQLTVGVTVSATAESAISTRSLFAGKVTLKLPTTAGSPKRINSKAYRVQPKSSERRFVIYVTRESLQKDEVAKSSRQLVSSIRSTLEAQGYKVSKLSNSGDVFTADFTTYTDVPWQQVGTSPARGLARFTRTRNNELIGTILLCDPRQWSDSTTKDFKKVVTGARIAR